MPTAMGKSTSATWCASSTTSSREGLPRTAGWTARETESPIPRAGNPRPGTTARRATMHAGGRRGGRLGAWAAAAWALLLGGVGWTQDSERVRELARAGRHDEAEREALVLLAKRETAWDSNETA